MMMMMMMMMMMLVLKWERTFKDKSELLTTTGFVAWHLNHSLQVKSKYWRCKCQRLSSFGDTCKANYTTFICDDLQHMHPSESLKHLKHSSGFCFWLVGFNLDNSVLHRGQQQSKCIRWKQKRCCGSKQEKIQGSKDCKLRIHCDIINLWCDARRDLPLPPPQEKKMAVWMFHDGLNLDAPTHVVTHRKDHVDLLLLMFLCCALGIGSQISFVCDLFLKTCSEKPSNVFLSYPNGCERTRRDCESLTANKYNCIQLAQAFFQDHKNCM